MSFLDDFKDLDTNNPGGWPASVKATSTLVVFILIVVLGYYYKTQEQRVELQGLEVKEEGLKTTFQQKYKKASRLEGYKAQLSEMKIILQSMLRQLPSKTEMPDLLVDISQTALTAGIDNELFEPGPEVLKDFYAEKPITLRMRGSYHQFGTFVSGVASLPRVVILTMHDISIKPADTKGPFNGELLLQGTAKTYRYLEDDEAEAEAQKVATAQAATGGSRR